MGRIHSARHTTILRRNFEVPRPVHDLDGLGLGLVFRRKIFPASDGILVPALEYVRGKRMFEI